MHDPDDSFTSRLHEAELKICLASQKFPHFTDPEGSVSHSQQPTTAPYPQPDESNVHLHILFP